MDKKFLVTNDPESAAILLKMGFSVIQENGKTWTFLNDKKIMFQKLENVAATNTLHF